MNNQATDVVTDRAMSNLSDLWKEEDYWAIWLGFFLLLVGALSFFSSGPDNMRATIAQANTTLKTESENVPFKTVGWYQAVDTKEKLKASNSFVGNHIKTFIRTPHVWKNNVSDTFFMSAESVKAERQKGMETYEIARKKEAMALAQAIETEDAAATENFQDEVLNIKSIEAIDAWRSSHAKAANAKKNIALKPYNQIPCLVGLMIFLAVFFGISMKMMGKSMGKFMIAFLYVFPIAVISYGVANNMTMRHYGIGYPVWAILFGLIISNTIKTPKWVMPAVRTEFYIKTGLVLLGAEILFGKILAIGIPGLFVAWIVTPVVLIGSFWFGKKILRMDSDTLNMTVSAGLSVCGVAASIAVASACRAKKEELTLAVGLSLVFTSTMMVAMPTIIKITGMPDVLGGAWMGGTIDSTGAVAAAGAFLGDRALHVAATIKMIQNILIGIIAFFVAIYWVTRVEKADSNGRIGAMEIWYRFPKFVIGFVATSIVFSIMYSVMGKDVGYVLIDHGVIGGLSKTLRGWFFCLAFVSIGLASDFRELKEYFKGGKLFILYICGQTFNLVLTLWVAYMMFYVVFPEITAKI